eukprot:CAMPEP_0174341534 /NCGR_PEP_ID=MMETSP0810-20121108/25512_1 /TAXON_ID=73025 ORGANISM="Eutreptiella gymnastica-like, Strain CCMP1594" /NCGR_SAMPLE_ID=MMETSP0810 /ASSEMBLY_ACC=CAM_ASM_000659 /LENGTH=73 /DNA_ID=CAMNT_0015463275 /DNA_START=518 /DNA_END=735 /DNA_ORIENTATION=-
MCQRVSMCPSTCVHEGVHGLGEGAPDLILLGSCVEGRSRLPRPHAQPDMLTCSAQTPSAFRQTQALSEGLDSV